MAGVVVVLVVLVVVVAVWTQVILLVALAGFGSCFSGDGRGGSLLDLF